MSIAKRLKAKAISAWLGPTGDAARRAVTRVKERISKEPRRLDFYFDITDPWSYLTAQAVARLLEAYPVEFAFHTITPPASDVDPAPHLRPKYALRDSQYLAEYWDIEFAGKKECDSGMVRDIGSCMIRERPAREQLTAATELSQALWSIDRKKLVTLLGKWGTESHGSVKPILNSAYAELRKAGHYQGGMIHYGDTWYWGIDRLPYLEAVLAADVGKDVAHVVAPRAEADRGALKLSEKPLTCEMWFSFRSPYSYIALEQIQAILAPHSIPLVLRQVAPMVVRGLPLPPVKKLYIVRDAKREADRLGIPFGELVDPLGPAVDHCLAIVHWANQRSPADGIAFVRSAMRGIWAEAKDPGEYVDLRHLVERAGLPWEEARSAIGAPAAATSAHENATDLDGAGLWGVPSFRIGDFVIWGQDRLPLLADRLRRHALATP
ncbi:MAG: DsbA family protein [Deltaproteobacteria bacterium]|nr:DsbA family protein [Deltaproteobacteria bacterium]